MHLLHDPNIFNLDVSSNWGKKIPLLGTSNLNTLQTTIICQVTVLSNSLFSNSKIHFCKTKVGLYRFFERGSWIRVASRAEWLIGKLDPELSSFIKKQCAMKNESERRRSLIDCSLMVERVLPYKRRELNIRNANTCPIVI